MTENNKSKYFSEKAIKELASKYTINTKKLKECLIKAEYWHDNELEFTDKKMPVAIKQSKTDREKYNEMHKHLKKFMQEWKSVYDDNTYKNFAVRLAGGKGKQHYPDRPALLQSVCSVAFHFRYFASSLA